MAFDRAKFLTRFIQEAREHISRLNEGLLVLEKSPDNAETLNEVFRAAHTIKGSAKMMKLSAVSQIAHKLEDVLEAWRQKKISPSGPLSDLLFEGVDTIGHLLDRLSAGEEVSQPPADICKRLETAAQEGAGIPDQAGIREPANEAPASAPPEEASAAAPFPQPEPDQTPKKVCSGITLKQTGQGDEGGMLRAEETIRISADKLDEVIKLMGEVVSCHNRSGQRMAEIREIEKLARRSAELTPEAAPHSGGVRQEEMHRAVRSLHRQIRAYISRLREDMGVHELLTDDLREQSIKLRMLPLSTIFASFPRAVRDMAESYGKAVELVIEGRETELDKKIIEKISDPLLHMIRNSVDHGIELPEIRREAGKRLVGTLHLSACYEGSNVLIRLADDGRGISVREIRERAVSKKLAPPEEIDRLSEAELINLIFRPGFSTSDIITDLSGRGVGMDVVRKNIVDDLKGTIEVETHPGRGTVFYIRLPLTMAVIHVLFIRIRETVFGIPANYVSEILRVPETEVMDVADRKAVRLRDQIIPVLCLDDVLGLTSGAPEKRDHLLILVTVIGGGKLGVVADALISQEDAVIKPLPAHMKDIPWVSGSIISGDGRIVNVLHMPKIIEASREIRGKPATAQAPAAADSPDPVHILLVEDSVSTREIEKSILESYGYDVTLAGDGLEGLEKARAFKYDLVITDVEMPRMDGFDLTGHLRTDEDYMDTPIILVTSLSRESDKRKGIQAGADAYIVKGDFDQSDLLDTVRSLVG